ncbi:hypothetical protein [Rhizobium laguerreae]|uniref:Uncharacterized protein n=1 Tax=Rhizobium laguerreae TaxID=1076926 RepID=A0A6N9ZEW4_9HYPH|nr:hypothetical protein [Rhizobium laguerreae]NEH91378.1 hypothetical protein [Rhizobium laguerreae]
MGFGASAMAGGGTGRTNKNSVGDRRLCRDDISWPSLSSFLNTHHLLSRMSCRFDLFLSLNQSLRAFYGKRHHAGERCGLGCQEMETSFEDLSGGTD